MKSPSTDNILSLIGKTPNFLLKGIAERVKARRLEKNLTQSALASRAGMAVSTYRRFERTGEISLRGLILLAIALDMTDEFTQLFAVKTYRNMDELLRATSKNRERASKNG